MGYKGSRDRTKDIKRFKENFDRIFGEPKQDKKDEDNLKDIDRPELLRRQGY